MRMKKFLPVVLAAVMTAGLCAGCGSSKSASESSKPSSESTKDTTKENAGTVYYLSFKPEQAEQWKAIAKAYTEETGVQVKVQTAASGTYEQTLKSEIAKKDAPTIFQVNGPVGYQNWKDYCMDLSDSDLYSWLNDKSMAIEGKDGGIYGIPYAVEGYGIIYNEEIMDRYFALDGAKAASMEEINNFSKLKEVTEDMSAKKDQLGIEGVFASTSFAPGEDWRWQTHLMNLPVYYEYQDKGVSDEQELSFEYNEQFKNIFDLYLNNSVTEPAMLGSKTVSDSMAEFALGKAAMVQNGNWAWGDISGVDGNTVKEDKIKYLPIYTGMEGEEKQGLCVGGENYFCINSEASDADQKASLDFIQWLFGTDEGKEKVTKELGFITPFNTFADDQKPTDPLAQEVIRYMENKDLTSVSWDFQTFPSQTFKDNLGASLLEYASGSKDWDKVVTDCTEDWKAEKEATAE